MTTLTTRPLGRAEIERIWTIDRGETIANIYRLEQGRLRLQAAPFEANGWPPGEAETYTPILLACFDAGGWFQGVFDGDRLVGVAVLEARFIGADRDQLQLKFLHVSRAYRGRGVGQQLFEQARAMARQWGARRLYISATPTEATINFYLRRGCFVTAEPDPELLALEPDDIHLECAA